MSAKKSSAEKVEIKSKKRKSAIKEKPARARQENSQRTARKKSLEKIKPDHQVKIQKALYEIADAASAVKDMQSFYKKLQKIIGKLMYAGSFFIASYDAQTGIVSWPYYLDEAGDISPEPMLLDETKGGTAYVIRTGKVFHASRDLDRLIKRGEMRVEGTRPVDAIGIPLKEGDTILGALAIQELFPGHSIY